MRQIKFKAWHIKRKEMYNVHGWHSEFVFKDTLDGVGCDGNPDYLSEVILLQFTEQLDPNNVEIYDGDILQHGENIYVVQKRKENCNWLAVSKDGRTGMMLSFCSRDIVLGNIYENPELIK